ncbi:anti-sigma factor domain-containing protein [Streptomyces sp. NPDC014870]|uniref:anti-sigma factor n=1 Tax=Streptomyces sp. NPDC014870 TaxID=3364925 RepID=UPI0036FE0AA3
MTPPEDPHLDAAAYVLHALPPAEEAAFANHLAGCEACRRDVAEFERTTAALASDETAPVPEELRARVLEQVSRTAQDGRPRPHGAGPPGGGGSPGRKGLRLALAASVAAVAALGAVAAWQHSEAEDARARAAQAQEQARAASGAFAEVLTAPDATVHTGELADGAEAAVVVSREQARSAFTARGLPALPSDKVYELWYAGEGGDYRPAGLLAGAGDRAARVLEGPLGDAVAVCLTVEPAGGSTQPTTEPLGVISIDA